MGKHNSILGVDKKVNTTLPTSECILQLKFSLHHSPAFFALDFWRKIVHARRRFFHSFAGVKHI